MDDPTDTCAGENRADPDSWDDPDIAEAWEDPPEIEPAHDVTHLLDSREA